MVQPWLALNLLFEEGQDNDNVSQMRVFRGTKHFSRWVQREQNVVSPPWHQPCGGPSRPVAEMGFSLLSQDGVCASWPSPVLPAGHYEESKGWPSSMRPAHLVVPLLESHDSGCFLRMRPKCHQHDIQGPQSGPRLSPLHCALPDPLLCPTWPAHPTRPWVGGLCRELCSFSCQEAYGAALPSPSACPHPSQPRGAAKWTRFCDPCSNPLVRSNPTRLGTSSCDLTRGEMAGRLFLLFHFLLLENRVVITFLSTAP